MWLCTTKLSENLGWCVLISVGFFKNKTFLKLKTFHPILWFVYNVNTKIVRVYVYLCLYMITYGVVKTMCLSGWSLMLQIIHDIRLTDTMAGGFITLKLVRTQQRHALRLITHMFLYEALKQYIQPCVFMRSFKVRL